MKKKSKITLLFVSTLEKHLQSSQYQDLIFEIRQVEQNTNIFYFG